jgi:predicted GH43/DUF377 family glycosyl hydrolase
VRAAEARAAARLAVCRGGGTAPPCDYYNDGVCAHQSCGCYLAKKAALATETCPLGKWDRPAAPPAPGALAAAVPSRFVARFDETNLFPGQPGKRFNPSLTPWKGGYLLAYRHGWRGCQVYVAELGRDLAPLGPPRQLALDHAEANYGREDPRFFWHNGRLHLAYVGVVGGRRIRHTNVLYARLTEDLRVERVFFPKVPRRNLWEKNHSYFSHGGRLYAVYSIAPHRILEVDGEQATWAHETPTPGPWHLGTEMRGGASPVLVGGEWWHFFHSRIETRGFRTYCTGLYAFEAKPPFRMTRIIPDPIQWADNGTRPKDQYCAAVFVCGAVRDGADWILSCGIHDRWSEFYKFSHADLEAALVEVPR